MRIWLVIAAVVLGVHAERQARNPRLSSVFENAGITSDIIPSVPDEIATITFVSEVCIGEELRETDVTSLPEISYKYKAKTNYTVMLIDPDLPSIVAPALRSALHWMVVNIPGDNIAAGTTTAVYVAPVSYPGSGCHRFLLLVYAQKNYLDVNNPCILECGVNRFRFSPTDFAKKVNLGELTAATLFRTCAAPIREEYYCRA